MLFIPKDNILYTEYHYGHYFKSLRPEVVYWAN